MLAAMGWSGPVALLLLTIPQEVATSRPPPTSALAALDAWHRERNEPEPQRLRGVSHLGAFEGEAVTTALVSTWQTAKSTELRIAAARALSEKRREGTLPILVDMLDTSDDDRLRQAAAIGLGRHGDAGVACIEPRLAALEERRVDVTVPMRPLLIGLGVAATERAGDLLARIALDRTAMERHTALSQLASAPDTVSAQSAREKAVRDADVNLAVEALQQLAARQWPGTKGAALGFCKRWDNLFTGPDKTANAVLVDTLAQHLDATTYLAFLTRAAATEGNLEALHPQALAAARGHAGFVAWLLARGMVQEDVKLRVAAVRICAGSDREPVRRSLLALLKAGNPEVAAAAIAAVAARGDRDAVAPLRDVLRAGPEACRGEALRALHGLLMATPGWPAEVTQQLGSPLAELRIAALGLLADLHAGEALPQAQMLLDDRVQTVREAAAAFCGRVRSISSIPLLIGRLELARGRMREGLLDALENLTALRFMESARWQQWWNESREDFMMPPAKPSAAEDLARKAAEPASPTPRTIASTTIPTFFKIPVVSQSVVFVLDVSGSMSAPTHGRTSSRLDETRRQLELALDAMSEAACFNLIFFSGTVVAHETRIAPADDKHKKSAVAAMKSIFAGGGTNLFDALERAFADPEIDTIYLLSDGSPTAGRLRDPDAIVAEVQTWNRARKVTIHTIAVGMDSQLLARLSALTGGQHRMVL
jgi:HEAT repeat protein